MNSNLMSLKLIKISICLFVCFISLKLIKGMLKLSWCIELRLVFDTFRKCSVKNISSHRRIDGIKRKKIGQETEKYECETVETDNSAHFFNDFYTKSVIWSILNKNLNVLFKKQRFVSVNNPYVKRRQVPIERRLF